MTSISPDQHTVGRPEMLKVHISTLADKTTSLYKAHEHLCHHNIHALFAVNGATELNVTEGMAIFRILDDDGNGILTIKDVINGLANHKEVVQLIERYADTPLGLLSRVDEVERLFDEIDKNRNKMVSKEEWKDFLALIIRCDIDYLVAKSMNRKCCYWGRGLEGEPRTTFLWWFDGTWLEKHGLIEQGWWEDFCYYQQNNHAILFLLNQHDDRHPLKKHSVHIEFVTQSFGLFLLSHIMLGYCEDPDPHQPSGCTYPPFYFTLCFVTIPVVIMRNFLHFLYRCPCVLSRHEMTTARHFGFTLVRNTFLRHWVCNDIC